MQKWISRIVLTCLLLLLVAFPAAQAFSGSEVVILRVGKADAILVMAAGHTVLIDAGEDEDADEILAFLGSRRIEQIDVMIITHYDKDHVGGADGILYGIPVGVLYDAYYEADTEQYSQYLGAIKGTNTPRFRVTQELVITLETLTLTLMPTALETDSDNDRSLAVSMDDGYHTFFFAGDAEEARIEELLAGRLAPHDVVKMPHHGRDKTNLAAFLDALSPSIAVITDSDKNPAEDAVLSELSARGIDTYQTRDGDIRILSGETEITCIQ